jgi:hypothetical protein
MSGHAYALAMAALDVNGPADAPSDWNAIPWRHHEGLPVAIDELSTKADVYAGHSLGFGLCAPPSQELNRSS